MRRDVAAPERVAERIRENGGTLSLTTVYRNLEVLEGVGLLRHTHIGHGAPTYHPAEHYDHVHVRCTACGAVESMPEDLLDGVARVLREHRGFELDPRHVALAGLCATCSVESTDDHDDAEGEQP